MYCAGSCPQCPHADSGAGVQGVEPSDLRQAHQLGGLPAGECGGDAAALPGEAGGLGGH